MAVLTPLKGLAAPTALTTAKAINVNNKMMDMPGMILLAQEKTQELINHINLMVASTDSTGPDPNLSVLNTALTTLS